MDLVTGATGFVGSRLVQALLDRGSDVRGFARRPGMSVPPASGRARLEFVNGDLLDREAVDRAVENCDVVFHCGAVIPGRGTAEHTWAVNVTGTAHVVDACVRHRVRRLIYLSTWAIYGDRSTVDASEDAPSATEFFKEGIYPQSKLKAEHLVRRAAQTHALDTVILRPCIIYGPGLSPAMELFAEWAQKRVKFLLGGGRSRLSAVYVDDVVEALLLAECVSQATGHCFNISDGRVYTKREMLERLAAVSGRPRIVVPVPGSIAKAACAIMHPLVNAVAPSLGPRFDVRHVRFALEDHTISCRKAIDVLGYRPKVLLAEGLSRALGSPHGSATVSSGR